MNAVHSLDSLPKLTRSFAPRLRNLAPAKNRERRAMIVMYITRPYTDSAAEVFNNGSAGRALPLTGLIDEPVHYRKTPLISDLERYGCWFYQMPVPDKHFIVQCVERIVIYGFLLHSACSNKIVLQCVSNIVSVAKVKGTGEIEVAQYVDISSFFGILIQLESIRRSRRERDQFGPVNLINVMASYHCNLASLGDEKHIIVAGEPNKAEQTPGTTS